MATPTRIYTVADNATGKQRLVRATHPAPALLHVARGAFAVRVATQEDLEQLLPAGVQVEAIKAEQEIPSVA